MRVMVESLADVRLNERLTTTPRGRRAGRVEHPATFQPMVGAVGSEHFVFSG